MLKGPIGSRASRSAAKARSSSTGNGGLGSRPHRREQADTLVTQAAERDLQHTGR